MPHRKWFAMAAFASLVALLSAGFSTAAIQDEEQKKEEKEKEKEKEMTLEELMEDVTATNNKINRTIRTPVAFKKSQDEIIENSKKLVELGKKAKKSEEALDDAKVPLDDPKKKWEELMDDFIKKSEALVETAEGGDQAKARASHTEVKKSCAGCHEVFQHLDDF